MNILWCIRHVTVVLLINRKRPICTGEAASMHLIEARKKLKTTVCRLTYKKTNEFLVTPLVISWIFPFSSPYIYMFVLCVWFVLVLLLFYSFSCSFSLSLCTSVPLILLRFFRINLFVQTDLDCSSTHAYVRRGIQYEITFRYVHRMLMFVWIRWK